jgi:hypothetical protein
MQRAFVNTAARGNRSVSRPRTRLSISDPFYNRIWRPGGSLIGADLFRGSALAPPLLVCLLVRLKIVCATGLAPCCRRTCFYCYCFGGMGPGVINSGLTGRCRRAAITPIGTSRFCFSRRSRAVTICAFPSHQGSRVVQSLNGSSYTAKPSSSNPLKIGCCSMTLSGWCSCWYGENSTRHVSFKSNTL